MSLDARLNKMMPGLTARERGVLVLRSLRERTPEDPAWRRTMPQDQSKEFNWLITLMNATNIYLPLYISMVAEWAEQMEVRLSWWLTMTQYGEALWELGKFVPANKRKAAEEAMAKFWPAVELPWDPAEHPMSWLNVSDTMEQTIRECVAHLWDDVQAIDTVLAEVATNFDGDDPLRPVMRGVLEKARRRLSVLHEFFSGKDAVEVTEPSEEALALARVYFDKGVELMDRI